MALSDGLGGDVLRALRDIAYDEAIFDLVKNEPVFSSSLMRNGAGAPSSLPLFTVENQFRRIAHGQPALIDYNFRFVRPSTSELIPNLSIDFTVKPRQTPPTNLHVLIGGNGVGKTRLLRDFATVAAAGGSVDLGTFSDCREVVSRAEFGASIFANVVHVSFSAFDAKVGDTDPVVAGDGVLQQNESTKVHWVGLPLAMDEPLDKQFQAALRTVWWSSTRQLRWRRALETLAVADPIIGAEGLGDLCPSTVDFYSPDDREQSQYAQVEFDDSIDHAVKSFAAMSSGHKIVILTITRLVELVEEQSLVLLDEPETHLHPPLLSALIRAITDLMVDRNGVAIVATHSPVVLQEVPKSCVSMLRRVGDDVRVSPLDIESFGESVSRLTSEVFGLDVTHTGYHAMLASLLADHNNSVPAVLEALGQQLGGEGRFVLHALALNADREAP
ncbi:MAG: AAA family ATPase [Propionibacteriaceae bacterium]|nr:AAA family ATPase [Propionibacteriaceae bacterium]